MLCSTHNCIMWWLFYPKHTTVSCDGCSTLNTQLSCDDCSTLNTQLSCDGCSIHHYAMFNIQLYHVMVVLSSTRNCIMWWLFYPKHTTVSCDGCSTLNTQLSCDDCSTLNTQLSCDGCSIHHYAMSNTQLYHVMVVLSIIMLLFCKISFTGS